LLDAFIWYITIQLLGLIFLPYTLAMFKRLPDRGYAFGKALSIVVISFIIWIAASIHILPNSRWAIILIVVLLAAGSLFLFWRRRQEVMDFIREHKTVIIATELVFLVSFISWCVVRAYNPAILYSEKFGDFGYLNAIMRSKYFPPHDHWLSGFPLNYYYFGHLIMATLTKLTGIVSSVSYNLSLALVFALTCTGAFGIVYNLVKLLKGSTRAALGFGMVAALFLVVLGNLEGFLEVLYSNGVGSEGFWHWVGINELDYPPYQSNHWYPDQGWWWWHAARVIIIKNAAGQYLDYTINEFPFFSFSLGDLHGHLMTLPFALLNLAICLEFLISPIKLGVAWLMRNWLKIIVCAICLGALMFINSWDFFTYALLFAVVMVVGEYMRRRSFSFSTLFNAGIVWLALAIVTIIIYWSAFQIMFSTSGHLADVSGGGFILQAYGGMDTRYFHFFIFWGPFLFITVSYILAQAWNTLRGGRIPGWAILLAICIPLLPLIVWGPTVDWGYIEKLHKLDYATWIYFFWKFARMLPLFVLVSLIILTAIKKWHGIAESESESEGQKAHLFTLIILFIAYMLFIGCELYNINDRGVWAYERNTTIYKIYYQAWVFMTVGSAFSLCWLVRRWRLISGQQVALAADYVVKYIGVPLRKPREWYKGSPLSGAASVVARTTKSTTGLLRGPFKGKESKVISKRKSISSEGQPAISTYGKWGQNADDFVESTSRIIDFNAVGSFYNSCCRWVWVKFRLATVKRFTLAKGGNAIAEFIREIYRQLYSVTSSAVARKSFIAVWWLVCIVLIAGASIYPVITTFYTTASFSTTSNSWDMEPTLDGIVHLLRDHPEEYEAIRWLNSEVEGAPVIVEAAAGSHYYGSFFRISAYTGLPTLVGRWGQVPWNVDMTQQEIDYREGAARTIYESEDVAEVKQVIADFDVTYVYVGHREISSYKGDKSADEFAAFLRNKFSSFMDVAFQNEGVIIYKVRE
jgi:YYY domain-containing protein